MSNIDRDTVDSFGDEWSRFRQDEMLSNEALKTFNEYFSIFPWSSIGKKSVGFDMGCGTGRWAKFIAPKVRHLNCIDPSEAINVAKTELSSFNNITFIHGSDSDNSIPSGSQDFGYSIGVLHHVPDTQLAIQSCVNLLKPNAPLLLYLYYRFDNKKPIYKILWSFSNILRVMISSFPNRIKNIVTDLIAVFIYFPLSKISFVMSELGINTQNIPLSYYKDHSFYTMRTDSRDRFGTPLEKRFTKNEITKMMELSGLVDIRFSNNAPYWCAIGTKK